jgi:transcriptional regulator with XRE-family HTH domain
LEKRNTIGKRLQLFIQSTGLQDNEFARKINATKQLVSDWKNGKPIPLSRISSIIEVFQNLNSHWLISGNGNMLLEGTVSDGYINTNLCTDPVCLKQRDELQRKLNERTEQLFILQQEKIEWLQKN